MCTMLALFLRAERLPLSAIRTCVVAAPPEGGESTGGTGQPPASAGTENAGDPIDWEAKYKEALGHSRDWEKKAKANKAAADELEKLKESQMSEAEKAAKRTQELEAQVAAYKAK
ncbi:MAG TPA: hypothetical protein P5201_16025, partial [Aminobacteriaceae bacterium]|nr:hypothetical protein [Aminobacteriaceae bacterium]